MIEMTLAQVAQLTCGQLVCGDGAWRVQDVALDTRAQTARPEQLFVALRGPRFDAHRFLGQARQRGWRAVLVEDAQAAQQAGVPAIIQVPDTLDALQRLAQHQRASFPGLPVVAITGSHGKTAVKELLASILSRRMTVHRSPGSYNSQVGVALALLGIRPEHEIAIIEAGISQPDEMARHARMIQPTLGALTHLGLAHVATLPTVEQTAREKMKLFEGAQLQALIAPASQRALWGPPWEASQAGLGQRRPRVEFGLGQAPPEDQGQLGSMWAEQVRLDAREGRASFTLRWPDGQRHQMSMSARAEHDVLNAACAAAIAAQLGCSPRQVRQGLAAWEPSPMRLELHTTPRGVTILNDAYSADPASAQAALKALRAHSVKGQRLVAALGSMLELGELARAEHERLGAAAAQAGVQALYAIGEFAQDMAQGAQAAGLGPDAIHILPDVEALAQTLRCALKPQDVVLLKASRAVGLERAALALQESLSPTVLTIDLGAIAHNFHAARRTVGPKTALMAVVKSYGYGNDATRVSKTLVREGVDMLAVAYPDEGVPLREAGVEVPILVMNTLAPEADKIARWGLTALVYRDEAMQALSAQAQREGVQVPVHLKVDTGMNRAGLQADPAQVVAFAQRLSASPGLRLTGVMTHLAAADEPEHDAFTQQQLDRFDRVLEALRAAGIDPGVVHAANTAAVWRFERARYDMVRLGIGLYGLSPSPQVAQQAQQTQQALRWTTQIIHVHEVQPGESVGYGRTWVAPQVSQVATIAAGYSDGLPRAMSNGGQVLIHGQRCPIVGRVCMDVSVVDVSQLRAPAQVGDEVVLFGPQLPIEELAARAQTISYEVLCNISARVRRVFVSV